MQLDSPAHSPPCRCGRPRAVPSTEDLSHGRGRACWVGAGTRSPGLCGDGGQPACYPDSAPGLSGDHAGPMKQEGSHSQTWAHNGAYRRRIIKSHARNMSQVIKQRDPNKFNFKKLRSRGGTQPSESREGHLPPNQGVTKVTTSPTNRQQTNQKRERLGEASDDVA